jgi:tRNA A37 threonylcarbamoyladenosine biosynthesis protein TsaE
VMVDRPGYHFIEWPQVADRLLDATTVSIEVGDDCRVIRF